MDAHFQASRRDSAASDRKVPSGGETSDSVSVFRTIKKRQLLRETVLRAPHFYTLTTRDRCAVPVPEGTQLAAVCTVSCVASPMIRSLSISPHGCAMSVIAQIPCSPMRPLAGKNLCIILPARELSNVVTLQTSFSLCAEVGSSVQRGLTSPDVFARKFGPFLSKTA